MADESKAAQPDDTAGSIDTARLIRAFREEREQAAIYRELAVQEGDHRMAYMLQRLAENAQAQTRALRERLAAQAIDADKVAGPTELSRRARLAIWLARQIGVRPIRGLLSNLHVRGLGAYDSASHLQGHVAIKDISQLQQGGSNAGNLRAAVFGVNDVMISNTSLIQAMAGAGAASNTLILAGVAGLLAGALSMAAGEFVSVRSQREFYEHQLELERDELEQFPDAERAELAVIYEAKGLKPEDADRIARTLIAEPELALDTMAREELGLNPDELGSPIGAAGSSFVSFAVGALVPVVPLFLLPPGSAVLLSITLAATALFLVGALLSLFTGRRAWGSGLRMLGIGATAGALTWLIGNLFDLGMPV